MRFIYLSAFLIIFNTELWGQDLKSEDLYRKTVPSVVTLTVTKQDGIQSIGSAFLTLKDGLAVTAWHVVKNASSVIARFSSGEEFDVSGLIDKDEKRDIAIVRIKVFGRPMLFLNSDEQKIGSKLYAIGAPKGLEFSISDGLLSQVQLIEGTKQLQFSCPVSPGNSGCPLLNSKGEVIGVVSWQFKDAQNLNFAVPSVYVRGLDISLPTKPWTDVRSLSPIVPKQSSRIEIDKLLSEILILQIDLSTALFYTHSEIVAKIDGFKDGVPTSVYSLERELKEKQNALLSLSIDDSASNAFAHKLQVNTNYMLESKSLLVEAIKTAQSNGGWDASSSDLVSRASAAYYLVNQMSPEEFRGVPSMVAMFSREVKIIIGLEHDSTNFKLGVMNWVYSPLGLVLVPEKSFAHKLGFRTGDRIIEFNGTKPESLFQIKRIINANLGMDIPVIVIRDGDRKEFEIEIPKKLPSE